MNKYAEIKNETHRDSNLARHTRILEDNKKKLNLANSFTPENAIEYFEKMKNYVKLFKIWNKFTIVLFLIYRFEIT